MKNKINELIIIKQLPVIEQMLDNMGVEIDRKINAAMSLALTEPEKVLSETKKMRAELNKELAELETARKNVKNEIMKPYLDFETIYKEKISDKYKKADKFFKSRIDEIEGAIKDERKEKLMEYFEEYCKAQGVECITFEDMSLKINISGSDKSYRDKIKSWIDSVKADLQVIETAKDEKTKLELLIDYKKDFDLQRTILEHDKKEREIEQLKREQQAAENTEEITAPITPEDTEVYTVSFKVSSTISKLRKLKKFLKENDMQYESN